MILSSSASSLLPTRTLQTSGEAFYKKTHLVWDIDLSFTQQSGLRVWHCFHGSCFEFILGKWNFMCTADSSCDTGWSNVKYKWIWSAQSWSWGVARGLYPEYGGGGDSGILFYFDREVRMPLVFEISDLGTFLGLQIFWWIVLG